MENVFLELGFIIVLAAVLAIVARKLQQPPLLGFLLTGIIAGGLFSDFLPKGAVLDIFSSLGIAFLLFMTGLSIDLRILREVGIVAIATGAGQILFTAIFGYVISLFLGFSLVEAAYVSLALTFSSTIIIVKLLSDKDDADTLYGRVALGFLLVQDIIAFGVLMFLSSIGAQGETAFIVMLTKAILLSIIAFLASKHFLPYVFRIVSKSGEVFFLTGAAWCFLLGSVSIAFELPLSFGTFLAGVSLAILPTKYDMSGKMRSLRDIFMVLVFAVLGMHLSFAYFMHHWIAIVTLSLLVVVGNPFIIMAIMGLFGYRKKTSFLAGLTVAQSSEFSILLVTLGFTSGFVTPDVIHIITWVTAITIAVSLYLGMFSDRLFTFSKPLLSLFERKGVQEKDRGVKELRNHTILIGHNRIGYEILNSLKRMNVPVVVIDHDPAVITQLKNHGMHAVLGDIADIDLIEDVNIKHAAMIISTDPDFFDNASLLQRIKQYNETACIVVTSSHVDESIELYGLGADYVLLPHLIAGKEIARILRKPGKSSAHLAKEKDVHLVELQERLSTIVSRSSKKLTRKEYLKDLREKVLSD